MINDDKPLLRIDDGKTMVYGSPWDGKHHLSRNASAPLKAIVWIYRSTVNHLEPIGKEDAYQLLIRQRYSRQNPVIVQRVLALQAALLETADFYKMYCNVEKEAAWLAWKGLNGI